MESLFRTEVVVSNTKYLLLVQWLLFFVVFMLWVFVGYVFNGLLILMIFMFLLFYFVAFYKMLKPASRAMAFYFIFLIKSCCLRSDDFEQESGCTAITVCTFT